MPFRTSFFSSSRAGSPGRGAANKFSVVFFAVLLLNFVMDAPSSSSRGIFADGLGCSDIYGVELFCLPRTTRGREEEKKGVEMSGMDPVKWKCLIRSGFCGKREKKSKIATDRYSFSLDAICASIVDIVGGLPGFY